MRLPALTPLRQFGKVLTFDPRHGGKTAILLVSQSALAPARALPYVSENWRPNEHGVIVGGGKLEGILDTAGQIGELSGFSLSLPSFERDSKALLAKRRLFEANGIGTFYAWEGCEERINFFDLKRGELLYTPDESLEDPKVDWNRHGLVFVHHEAEPRTLSLKLTLRRG